MENFIRKCPKCNKEIVYKSKRSFARAEKDNRLCLQCANESRMYVKFVRNCPICNKDIKYKKQEIVDRANKYNEICNECSKRENNLKITKLYKHCPKCNEMIYFKNYQSFKNAIDNNTLCRSCIAKNINNGSGNYNRHCPTCNKLIGYGTKESYDLAEFNKILCANCSSKISILNNKKFKKQCPQCNADILYTTEKALIKSIENNTLCLKCSCNTEESKHNRSVSHIGLKGKSIYKIWLEKYGKEEADRKFEQWRVKLTISLKNSNYMFNRPAPKGSGNGISGHYHEHYFRSLLELNYLLYLIDNNINFINAENKQFSVEYIHENKIKTYYPDFYLCDTNEIIEVKPTGLTYMTINKLKFAAGLNKYGDKYKVITEKDMPKMDINRICQLYREQEIIFDKGYSERFEKYYKTKVKSL